MSRPIDLKTEKAYQRELQAIGRLRMAIALETRVPEEITRMAIQNAENLERALLSIIKRLRLDVNPGND